MNKYFSMIAALLLVTGGAIAGEGHGDDDGQAKAETGHELDGPRADGPRADG